MSQSVTTLTNGGSGIFVRRSESNLGVEDRICDLEDDDEDEERDATLRRPDPTFHFGTARKVNGTSERNSTGNGNKNKKFMFFPNKGNKGGEQKESTENNNSVAANNNKTPRRVERSKSELGGDQVHKKPIPTMSQSNKGDLSETNKKILAHWNSGVERGMKLFQYGFAKTKWEEPQQKKTSDPAPDFTSKMSTLGSKPINKSVDGLQQSLQNVLTLKKHFDASQIFSTLTLDGDKTLPAKKSDASKHEASLNDGTPEEKDCLQKFLEMDHGEFQFIDDSATLTRAISPPASASKNLSISSLASEIFQELGQSSLAEPLPKPDVSESSRFRHHHQRRQRNLSTASMSAVPLEMSNGRYDTSWNENLESNRRFQNGSQIDVTSETTLKPTSANDGANRRRRRQRNLSSASMSAVVLADETPSYMTTSWNGDKDNVDDDANQRRPTFQNDSQLIASLIADQTLFLRHHQKRKQQRRQQQLWSIGKYQQQQLSTKGDESTNRLQQQQLIDQASQHLLLRRCSSLTQTYPDEDASQDASLSSRSSVVIQDNGSSRLSSPSTNIRFLYTGKYRPAFQQDPQSQPPQLQPQPLNGNNNDDDDNRTSNPAPWVLSNKLSSFARRRRSSSTSLHTYDDDNDESVQQFVNNNKKLNGGGGKTAAVSDYR